MAEKDIVKMITVENDKVFVSATIKLGLENFSSVDVSLGLTKQIEPQADVKAIADDVFYNSLLPKAEEYVKALMDKVNPTVRANAEAKAKAQAQTSKQSYQGYQKNYGNKNYYNKGNYGYRKGGEAGE